MNADEMSRVQGGGRSWRKHGIRLLLLLLAPPLAAEESRQEAPYLPLVTVICVVGGGSWAAKEHFWQQRGQWRGKHALGTVAAVARRFALSPHSDYYFSI